MTRPTTPDAGTPAVVPATSPRALLRHTVATLAYRGGKAIRGGPSHFAGFVASNSSRTPVEILAHVGDLLDWALWLARGEHRWHDSAPLAWDDEVARFYTALDRLDAHLAGDTPIDWSIERIFQGPIADALTHVGQLTMLRRMAGSPVMGENYAKADIVAGRVGTDQTPPRVEFG